MKYAAILVALLSTVVLAKPGEFDLFAERRLDAYLRSHPDAAVALGFHEFDGETSDVSMASLRAEISTLKAARRELSDILSRTTDAATSVRARAVLASIDNELFGLEVQKSFFNNPMTYASPIDVNIYAKRDFAPKKQRMRSAISALGNMRKSMIAARANLSVNVPRVFITTAIDIADGGAEFMRGDLLKAFEDVNDPKMQEELKKVANAAARELTSYSSFLKRDLLPNATDQFAIGRGAYVKMLAEGELISQSPEEVLAIGMEELRRQQQAFNDAAKIVDPARPAMEVWKEVQRDHPTEQNLIPDTRKHLEEIRQFLVEKDLVSFPSNDRVRVEETPRFERATSFASMDTPGAFETKATEAFYYVTPTEPEWDAQKKEEWLTAFNYYTTDVVSIHEAYPGHYMQYQHLNVAPLSRIEKIIGSYAYIEGWAHYTEQMALDEGFPPKSLTKDDKTAAKYRMAQASEALLRCCRLVASIKMHTQRMTLDQATKFFIDNAYYEQAPARAEAERGSYDPGYCFYTIGKLQILKLRDDWKAQEGDRFSLKRFHDEVLKNGALPIRLLREKMLTDKTIWDKTM